MARLREDQPLRGHTGAQSLRDRAEMESLLRVFAQRHPDMVVTSLRPCWTLRNPRSPLTT